MYISQRQQYRNEDGGLIFKIQSDYQDLDGHLPGIIPRFWHTPHAPALRKEGKKTNNPGWVGHRRNSCMNRGLSCWGYDRLPSDWV